LGTLQSLSEFDHLLYAGDIKRQSDIRYAICCSITYVPFAGMLYYVDETLLLGSANEQEAIVSRWTQPFKKRSGLAHPVETTKEELPT